MSVDGFLVIDKAPGITSHDVVAIARRALGTRKVGHAGTLDPMATGVLVLGFGNGTRLLQYITDGEKTYEATIVLGASTVTDDAEGELLTTASPELLSSITNASILEALAPMQGTILQRPSSVSAVKVAGERAYARVRSGEDVKLPAREVHISELKVREIRRTDQRIEIDISVTCGAGTFIRAIARDCGETLAVGGHLSSLRRTKVAPFDLTSAVNVPDLKDGKFTPIKVETLASLRFHVRDVSALEQGELRFGRALSPTGIDSLAAAIYEGKLVALLQDRDGKANPIAVFAGEA